MNNQDNKDDELRAKYGPSDPKRIEFHREVKQNTDELRRQVDSVLEDLLEVGVKWNDPTDYPVHANDRATEAIVSLIQKDRQQYIEKIIGDTEYERWSTKDIFGDDPRNNISGSELQKVSDMNAGAYKLQREQCQLAGLNLNGGKK